jgi:putative transposase
VRRYRCLDAQKAAEFPVTAACQAGGVSTSAWYAWAASAAQGPSQHQREEAELVAEIRTIHTDSGGTYGSPRVHAELRRRGWGRQPQAGGAADARPRPRRAPASPPPSPDPA